MQAKPLDSGLLVAGQISLDDLGSIAAQGIRTVICNRPDNETPDQPDTDELRRAAARLGIEFIHIPVVSGSIKDSDIEEFAEAISNVQWPILAYCRSGMRSTSLWALSNAGHLGRNEIVKVADAAGYDLKGLIPRIDQQSQKQGRAPAIGDSHDVIIVGGGAGGIGTAASLLKRDSSLDIAIIEPNEKHYYQPGWTMVGAGVFEQAVTERPMQAVMPGSVTWKHAAVAGLEPETNAVVLEDGTRVQYRVLVVAPGLKLDWERVEGLAETLGKNGVTSNYRFDLAPYTWKLVQELQSGKAVFTQPPMPIKCAGAPQKAMYLSCDHWFRKGRMRDISVEFRNAGPVLFGVNDYVPALMKYVEKYNADLCFGDNLIAVDGQARKAFFESTNPNGNSETTEVDFDMLHVCPPQTAPDFVASSPLANEAGWVDVSQDTLCHTQFGNIFAVGDVHSAPNAKTAAAVRKQAPVVAENVISTLAGRDARHHYDGYGSCPLTVERGKIVLAEFGYGGKHLPTFPQWLINSFEPTRLAWFMKARMLPPIYWEFLLKGREWLASPVE